MSDPNKPPETPPQTTTTQDNEGEDKKTTKIKVQVGREPEIESLRQELEAAKAEKKRVEDAATAEKQKLSDEKAAIQKELDEKAAVLQQQALAEFEKEKTAIMDMIKDSKLTEDQKAEIEEKLQSPKNLEIVKSLITMMAAAIKEPSTPPTTTTKPPLSGKAPFIPPEDAEQFPDKIAMVDELYKRAYYEPHLYTQKQVADAKAKIDMLFRSLIGGKSWTQLKALNPEQELLKQSIMSCPRCGRTFIGEIPPNCQTCGYPFKKYETRDFKQMR